MTYMSHSNCPHIGDVLAELRDVILEKYRSVVSWNVFRASSFKHSQKRRKIASPTCGTCDISLARPFACLHCSYTGCWGDGHIVSHLRDKDHAFCVDSKTGFVFCYKCDDFIYDADIEATALATVLTAEEKQTGFQFAKKPREPYRAWVPSAKEVAALEGATVVPCQGRRGLLNLGQTCFLNVVLQCLVHNPLLRNYFLSDKHNHKQCKIEHCTCCEMDKLFTEVYSEDASPFGPVTFLSTTWNASSDLAGYAQQDAHEFFIATLQQIHASSRGSTNVSCNCVIHTTFEGQLQSDVKCERCGNVRGTIDPMLDISLELRKVSSGENTLASCLRKYTSYEKLGAKEYICGTCGDVSNEASKRLSFRKLPTVLSFQFKRFEHKGMDKSSARKIDTPVKFPATLNMAPFTTMYMKEVDKGYSNPISSCPGPEAIYEYDLFAVINHQGQLNNGHYTNFARYGDEWYRFDDDKVSPSNLSSCLSSSAYMCFYVKRHLEYKPHITPSYRETALTAEKEKDKDKERERDKDREKDKDKEKDRLEKEKEREREKELEDALLATVEV